MGSRACALDRSPRRAGDGSGDACFFPQPFQPQRLVGGERRLGGAAAGGGVQSADLPERPDRRLSPSGQRPLLPARADAGARERQRAGEQAGDRLARNLRLRLVARLRLDRRRARPRTRRQAPRPDRRDHRRSADDRARLLLGSQLLAGRRAAGVQQGGERRLPAPQRRLPVRHPHWRDAPRRPAGPPHPRPPLAQPALGPERQDRLRQAARRQAAQVWPQERALSDEPGREAGAAIDPHERRAAPLGPVSDAVVCQRQAPAGPVQRPGHDLCGHRQSPDRRPASPHRSHRAGLRRSRALGRRQAVLGATGGFEPGPGHDVATVPYGGGKPKVLAKNAFEPDWSR